MTENLSPPQEPIMPDAKPFLTAQWRNLAILNYEVDPALLSPHLPAGTELDLWQGRALISLVGFQFLNTKLKGWAIPFHQNFPEVNLRFYVRRDTAEGRRRGVVFLKELVPKAAIAWVANTIYHEHYLTVPMSQHVQLPGSRTDRTGRAEYRWQHAARAFHLSAAFAGLPQPLVPGSEPEFITEHYWGYTRCPNGMTQEYRVDHPPWRVWSTTDAAFTGDASELYGREFAAILQRPPCSSLMAEGSAVTVYAGRRVEMAAARHSLSESDREITPLMNGEF